MQEGQLHEVSREELLAYFDLNKPREEQHLET